MCLAPALVHAINAVENERARRAADLERLRHQLDMMLRMGGLKLQPSRDSTTSQPLLSPEASDVGSIDELITALSTEISGAQDASKGGEKYILVAMDILSASRCGQSPKKTQTQMGTDRSLRRSKSGFSSRSQRNRLP